MRAKDTDSKNELQNSIYDLEKISKLAIKNMDEELESIKNQLEAVKPSLNTEAPVPNVCKYIRRSRAKAGGVMNY